MSDENESETSTEDTEQAPEAETITPVDDGSVPVLDHVVIPGDILAAEEDTPQPTLDEETQGIHSALDMASERPVVTQEIAPQTDGTDDTAAPAETDNNAASDMASAMLYELTDRLHARLSPQIEALVDNAVRDAVIAALTEAGPSISNKVKQSLETRVEELLAESIAVAIDELIKEQPQQDNS